MVQLLDCLDPVEWSTGDMVTYTHYFKSKWASDCITGIPLPTTTVSSLLTACGVVTGLTWSYRTKSQFLSKQFRESTSDYHNWPHCLVFSHCSLSVRPLQPVHIRTKNIHYQHLTSFNSILSLLTSAVCLSSTLLFCVPVTGSCMCIMCGYIQCQPCEN